MGEGVNQPKFKIGDKVTYEAHVFEVDLIRRNKAYEQFEYQDSNGYHSCLENSLELYQEPQKKKLYAYRVRGSTGIFYSPFDRLDESNEMVVRTSGHDKNGSIEYPEGK